MRNTFTTLEVLNILKANEIMYKGKTITDAFEPSFSKNTGFNRDKSDAIDGTSSVILATTKAVGDLKAHLESYSNTSESDAKAYTDTNINSLRDEILGGASAAYDTLLEIQQELESNDTDIGDILTALDTKLNKSGGIMTGDITMGDNYIYGASTNSIFRLGDSNTLPIELKGAANVQIQGDSNSNSTVQYLSLKAGVNALEVWSDGGVGQELRNQRLRFNGYEIPTFHNVTDSLTSTDALEIASATAVKTLQDNKLDKTAKAVDSELLDGLDSTDFLRTGTKVDQLVSSNNIEVHDGTEGITMSYNSGTKSIQFSIN